MRNAAGASLAADITAHPIRFLPDAPSAALDLRRAVRLARRGGQRPRWTIVPASADTIAAGGDILLDRGVAKTVTVNGKGVDYPWEGGRVEITGYRCCSQFGHKVPEWSGQEMEDTLVFYALGNLVFDQDWSEMTMQGAIVELRYHGTDLVQARIHPTLVVDDAQPNLSWIPQATVSSSWSG